MPFFTEGAPWSSPAPLLTALWLWSSTAFWASSKQGSSSQLHWSSDPAPQTSHGYTFIQCPLDNNHSLFPGQVTWPIQSSPWGPDPWMSDYCFLVFSSPTPSLPTAKGLWMPAKASDSIWRKFYLIMIYAPIWQPPLHLFLLSQGTPISTPLWPSLNPCSLASTSPAALPGVTNILQVAREFLASGGNWHCK